MSDDRPLTESVPADHERRLARFDCDLTRKGTGNWRYKRANHRFTEEAYLTDGPPLER
jgi:hypothetical protein